MDRLPVYNQPLDLVPSSKLLEVNVLSDLKWSTHIDYICAKASINAFMLYELLNVVEFSLLIYDPSSVTLLDPY